ncbi:MAG: histidine kinase sensor protein [Bacteroidetes bacterium]|nr:histidine kinase sensor protein [Bacteroidota bacterium]
MEKKGKSVELISANKELDFHKREKGKRAAELVLANIELQYQNEEKEKRAAELSLANIELVYQNKEKEKRASELVTANLELAYQNTEKEKRAAELSLANIELVFQNEEKEKRAAELVIANRELLFQNKEKENRAAELATANLELAYQNGEKEKRAAELATANLELIYQNQEKEKRAAELVIANKDLEQFAYIASHDLQEPLRTISNYMRVFEEDYLALLDDKAPRYLLSVNKAIGRMSVLIKALLDFSRLDRNKTLVYTDCTDLISNVLEDLSMLIHDSHTTITVGPMPQMNLYEPEMRQVFQNLISNAIKFQEKDARPEIHISAEEWQDKWKFAVRDNGIGIAPAHYGRIFEVFRRLHSAEEYAGNGIGLANCKKIIQLHKGEIWVESIRGQGSTFFFTISTLSE